MRLIPTILVACCLAAVACAPRLQADDLHGDWRIDNASLPKSSDAQLMANAVMNLSFDQSFRMSFQPVSFKGRWTYDDGTISITPATMEMTVQGRSIEFKVDELADKFGPVFDQSPEGRKQLQALESAGKPLVLKVSDDGRTLTTADGVAWKKRE